LFEGDFKHRIGGPGAGLDDVKDLCAGSGITVGPDTPLVKVEEVVRKSFDARIGIWRSVERAPVAEAEIYDLVIHCVDFSTPGKRVARDSIRKPRENKDHPA